MVAIALAGFIVTGIVLVTFPPALPAITGFAIGGFKLFAFLGGLPLLGTVPAAAAATFGAICAASFLATTGLLRGIGALFGLAAESAQDDIYQRNLAFMNANPLAPVDLDGNRIDAELVPFIAAGHSVEEARKAIERDNFDNSDPVQKDHFKRLGNLNSRKVEAFISKQERKLEEKKQDERRHEEPLDRTGKLAKRAEKARLAEEARIAAQGQGQNPLNI